MRSQSSHAVVVFDGSNEYWPGALIERAKIAALEEKGTLLLPVDPTHFKRSAVGGFFMRPWGSGWPLNGGVPRLVTPMVLHVGSGSSVVHWAARLVPDREATKPLGQLRLVSNGSLANVVASGLSADPGVDLGKLEEPDEQGGWNIQGSARLTMGMDAYYGFGLYGAPTGVQVVFTALTQA
jgi:hypothetical protein